MNELLEKIKGLDKRILIGVGIAAAVVVILIIALAIGGGKKPTNNENVQNGTIATETGTETSTEIFGTEDLEATEVLGTEMVTETTETEMESEVTSSEVEYVGGVEQKPITTAPDGQEVMGLGSKDQPYEVIPDLDTMSVTTVEVPAGKVLYYTIQRVGGMYLTIEDSDAYVITSSGNRYDANNGKVAFVVEDAMANEYVSFQIGNKGGSGKVFTIKFSNLNGSYQNPEELSELSGSKSLSSGDEDGWYYRYTATETGKIRFYIEYTAESDITVTNLSTSAVRNFEADGNGNDYIELDVTAGDRIMIQICVKPDSNWDYPATDITWRGEYQ